MSIALVGGTGLNALEGFEVRRSHAIDTPFGSTSMPIEEGDIGGQALFFLHRHGGQGKPIPPHLVNYRANVWALHHLGVSQIVAANAVGAISPHCRPGALILPDQLIDYTWGRAHTFDDGECGELLHIDFTQPYGQELRQALLRAAQMTRVACVDGGVLAVVQGPRLETAAEVNRLAADGADLVGMTGMPEASLAREKGMSYAALCMVVNTAAGIDGTPISMASIHEILGRETQLLRALLEGFLASA